MLIYLSSRYSIITFGLGYRLRNNCLGMTSMWLLWASAPYIGPERSILSFLLPKCLPLPPLPSSTSNPSNLFHSNIVLLNLARDLTIAGPSEVTWYTRLFSATSYGLKVCWLHLFFSVGHLAMDALNTSQHCSLRQLSLSSFWGM